ncbi:MAG: hypothetical protein QOJ65_673, partial [Fimbriimonadaceae bacterium]|nr:hypothetical protein [Fimbriimonadaceae bacterium]
DGSATKMEVEFAEAARVIHLDLKKDVISVELDPDHETLHSTPLLDAKMHDLKDYARVDYIRRLLKDPPDAKQIVTDALTRLPHPDRFGTEFLLRFSLGGILRGEEKNAEAKEQLERSLACPVRKEEFVPLAYLRLARANEALGNKAQVERCLDAMVSAEATLRWPSGSLRRAKQLFPDHRF